MGKWLRRIRGALGMGVIWGATWSAAGMIPRWLFGFNTDVPFPIVFGVLGFVAGVTFAGIVVLTESRRSLGQVSPGRFAAWGALGGFLLSAVFTRVASLGWGDVLAMAPTFALASAACAAGSLALARRSPIGELSAPRDGLADAQLADREKRKLLRGRD